MPKGALAMLVLRVLQSGPLHGYAIAQRIRKLSDEVLEAEEGSLYPALQRILLVAIRERAVFGVGRGRSFHRSAAKAVRVQRVHFVGSVDCFV